jgi:xanthine dehydrogenase accessory factor
LSTSEIISKLKDLLNQGTSVVLCTLVEKNGSGPRDEGAKMLIDHEGKVFGTIGGGSMERLLIAEALKALKDNKPRTVSFALGVEPLEGSLVVDSKCGGEVRIFMDVLKPDPRLVIIGSGHIGMPLAKMAHEVGFQVIIIDDAPTATFKRFPFAKNVRSGSFVEELKLVETTSTDFIAIVHGETPYELEALRRFLPDKPAYIGVLGSKNKINQHKEQLLSEGFAYDDLKRIKGPIGINIGARNPEEIAVSIVAELIEIRHLGEDF